MDENFINLRVIDTFESLIWTERYSQAGDFEIYTPVDMSLLQIVVNKPEDVDYYVWLKESDQQMILESVKVVSEVETGAYMTISGRSLESILERRIIWEQTILNGKLQNGVKKLINESIIDPEISDRKIPNFIFEDSTDPNITSLTIRAQYTGDNLYDVIIAICDSYNLGFQVYLNEKHQFVFRLYFGTDRSYDQIENPYVIFSPKFENIINSNYLKSINTFKNVALVLGEDEGNERRRWVVGSEKGLARRELYVDARDIQSETEDGGHIPDDEYNAQLDQRGTEKLADCTKTEAFEGQIDATQTFVYGIDFVKGDIIQIVNEFGIEAKARITEFIRIQDTTGYETYPTFSVMDYDRYE